MRNECTELWEMPSPKHFPGVHKKTSVADAEETHHEPASSVQREAEGEWDAEHFQGLLEPSGAASLSHRSVQLMTVCRAISGASNPTHQPGSQTGVYEGKGNKDEDRSRLQRE